MYNDIQNWNTNILRVTCIQMVNIFKAILNYTKKAWR